MTEDMTRGKQTVTDDEIITFLKEGSDPIYSAQEVAEKAGVTRQCAHKRLQQLHDEGRVERKKSGSRTVIWWPAE